MTKPNMAMAEYGEMRRNDLRPSLPPGLGAKSIAGERYDPPGRIGPNAAIQLAAALRAQGEMALLETLFAGAGRAEWLESPPHAMIAAADAARLHVGLRQLVEAPRAEAVLSEAGRLTGLYLLAHRIPARAQTLLKWLPRRWAVRALTHAIAAHAWTFAGAGRFEAHVGRHAMVAIHDNPLCQGLTTPRPACVWHAAVLQTLFAALVAPWTRVVETECAACGGACCRFQIDWVNKTGSDSVQ